MDTLIRATTSSILTAANQAIEAERRTNARETRRGSTRHLSSDIIRQLGQDFEDDELDVDEDENSRSLSPKLMRIIQHEHGGTHKRSKLQLKQQNNNNVEENDDEQHSDEEETFKRPYRRHSSIVSEKSVNGIGDALENGPCSLHLHAPDLCSHTKFKNVSCLMQFDVGFNGCRSMQLESSKAYHLDKQYLSTWSRCRQTRVRRRLNTELGVNWWTQSGRSWCTTPTSGFIWLVDWIRFELWIFISHIQL